MALAVGTHLGPYEVLSVLGSGGMGEVYRARDTKLGREVAIKILHDAWADDPERIARFDREAKTLAALNHPNIAHIHGLEESDGTRALVMELVEGVTLAERLASGHRLPLDETLAVARQVAEALEAAHGQGVVHRDLKPSNIKLRPDGTVKVLDFGLAKAMEPAGPVPSGLSQSPTITTPAMTQAGMILGTAAYMSPEQARGKPVDKRTDVWAFGCVLYEMLTGRRLFEGDEVSDTLAFVLTKDPDWRTLPPETPPAMHRLLRRCLVRDRAARLPDIGSARLEVDEARTESSQPVGQTSPTERRPTAVWRTIAWAAMAGIAVMAAIGIAIVPRGQAPAPIVRAAIPVRPADRLLSGFNLDSSLGHGRPSRTALALSPDGRLLVFTAERQGRVQLYLRPLDQLDATPIGGTEGAMNPFFSPDGQSLGFYADGALKTVPVNGGPVVTLCKTDLIFGASWGRTGQILFAHSQGGLWQVPALVPGGTPTSVTRPAAGTGEVSHRLPQLLPDGQTVLFTVTSSSFPSWDDTAVAVQSLASASRKTVIPGGADARYVDTGHLVFVRSGTLMAVPFDLRRLEVTGPQVAILADVMQAGGIQPLQIDTGAGQFATAESGSLVYVTGGMFPQNRWSLVWVDRNGRTEPLRVPPGAYLAPRLSPDGKRVAFNTTTGDWDLSTYDIARQVVTRLPMKGQQSLPLWTPEGSRLFYYSFVDGRHRIFSIDPDASGSPEQMMTPEDKGCRWPNDWTSDGGSIAVVCMGTGIGDGGTWIFSRTGKAEPQQIVTTAGSAGQADFAPDDRWVAYSTFQSLQVYVQPYPALNRQQQISRVNGLSPGWRRDGRELYYMEDASGDGVLRIRMMAVPVTTTPTFSAGAPRMLFEGAFRADGPFRAYDVTPDGRFLMVQEIPQPPTRASEIVLIQNWTQELKQRVPAK